MKSGDENKYYAFWSTPKTLSIHDAGSKKKCDAAAAERNETERLCSRAFNIPIDSECYVKHTAELNEKEIDCVNSPNTFVWK